MIVSKEIEMRGTFRFHEEFGLAVDLINKRRVDMNPLLTGVYGVDDAVKAFEVAGDRNQSMKVQIAF
jgi:L-idonate 5-dehydrogenase